MNTLLFDILIPAAVAILFVAGNLVSLQKKPISVQSQSMPHFLRRRLPEIIDSHIWIMCLAGCFLVGEVLLFLLLDLLISVCMTSGGNGIPVLILIWIAVLPYCLWMLKYMKPQWAKLFRFCKKAALCSVCLLLCEIVLFNGKSFSGNTEVTTLTAQDITIETTDTVVIEGDQLIISGDAALYLYDLPENVGGIVLKMQQEEQTSSRRFLVQLGMEDEDFQYTYQTVGQKYTMGYSEDCSFTISPYGKIYSLQLKFSDITSPVTLTAVEVSGAVPFSFSILRYLILLALFILLMGIRDYRLYRVTYQGDKPAHSILVNLMIVLCTLSAIFYFQPDQTLISYTKGDDYTASDPYVQLFDAFQNGRVSLNIAVDENLEQLDNLYDRSERDGAGVSYAWDYAYYDGNYYVYFGAAPVIVFYYPFYILTGKLPTMAIATAFFSLWAIFFFCEAILAALRLMKSRPNLLLLLFALPASVCCLGAYFALQYTDKYYLAIASGLCFISLCLWLGLRACSTSQKHMRCLLFALSGLALAICVASRPTMALLAAVLLPFFFGILTEKSQKLSHRLAWAGSFVIPLCAGLTVQMLYNKARFDTIFSFGAEYQLTVNDPSANALQLSDLPAMLYHFVFQLPGLKQTFPFFQTTISNLNNYGSYTYADTAVGIVGVCSFVFISLGVLYIPFAWSSRKKKPNTSQLRRSGRGYVYGVTRRQRNAFLIFAFLIPVFVGLYDFCFAGINQRYIVDMMPLLSMGAAVVLLRSVGTPGKHRYRYVLSLLACGGTILYTWLLMLGMRDCNLARHCPNLYEIAEDLLIFW